MIGPLSRRAAKTVSFGPGDDVGAKANSLRWLARKGALVPRTWVVQTAEAALSLDLADGHYAVRSSALTEDGADTSFAGVFLTELDVAAPSVPDAVRRVMRASGSAHGSVIVQEMVYPEVSGVSFSRNPVTGLSDTVVEAIEGRGDALLQDGSDPMRWVWRNGEFVERPASAQLDALASRVVGETRRLASSYGPADLEWVWDGDDIYYVQIRPITSIDSVPIYSRRIAKDVMPGMIRPLVWSINVPMVNKAWVRLFTETVGPNDLNPETLAKSFAYRSYFDMRAIGDIFELAGMPRDSLENLLGLPGSKGPMRPGITGLARLPRLVGFAIRTLMGVERLEAERERLHAALEAHDDAGLDNVGDADILRQIEQLIGLGSETAYINIVFPLLANIYVRRLDSALEKSGHSLEDVGSFDLGSWAPVGRLDQFAEALGSLDDRALERVKSGDLSALNDEAAEVLRGLLDEFGYLSENTNDLSTPRWRDDPGQVASLAVARLEARYGGDNPSGKQSQTAARLPKRLSRKFERAQRFARLRESAGATFAFGYGLLRPRFIELGRRLVDRGQLDASHDIFYLSRDIVNAAIGGATVDLRTTVASEKKSMAEVEHLMMPEMIVGEDWVPESRQVSRRLVGVGASRGRYRGRARYIGSLDDAHLLEQGEILVVEHSDVAWTSLYDTAGAVVSATGGLLAHSSITAREKGIPCVASVGAARLLDGATVLVDGFSGEVLIEDS